VPARIAPASFGGRATKTPYYRWEDLAPGTIADGPAVVAGGQATVVIPPAFRFRIDEFGNLVAVRSTDSRTGRRRRATAMAAAT
jgi:N-methylhydantoinase A/oxoprolinase/acetone carboxylase beta subunit